MNKFSSNLTALVIAISLLTLSSCSKEYAEYDNYEVVENTYTGNIEGTGGGEDPDADFTGDGDSGTYSFVWENPQREASVNFDVTTQPGGSVQVIVNDARGNEVLNKTRPEGENDTFSGVTDKGRKGKWLITLVFTDFDGDGSYSIHPGD